MSGSEALRDALVHALVATEVAEILAPIAVALGLREAANYLRLVTSPTLNGDPFIRASDWAARLLEERADELGRQA